MLKVLISAATSSAAISYSKYLKSVGYYVLGMDADIECQQLGEAFYDEFYISPLATNEVSYIKFLNDIGDQFDVFIPFIDEEIKTLMVVGKDYPDLINRVILSEPNSSLVCLSKINFQKYCIDKEICVAPLASSVPCIYKPDSGRGGKGVVEINDKQIYQCYKDHFKEGVFQKKIEGQEYTIDAVLDSNSNIQYMVPRKRIQAAGVSRVGELDYDLKVIEFCENVINKFRFKYIINLQVIVDNLGDIYLIEINPRLAGSAIFGMIAGIPILEDVISLKIGEKDSIDQVTRINKIKEVKGKKIIRYWSEFEAV